jgi:membrane associated rhomboid family serine protease
MQGLSAPATDVVERKKTSLRLSRCGAVGMGIYDREYYRRSGPGFLDALFGRGQVCKWLILINVGVFVLQMLTRVPVYDERGHLARWLPGPVTDWLILDTNAVKHGEIWRLLTYSFLHDTDGVLHIIFNMLFLWWFGSDVEDLYGPKEFLSFYLVSAFLGGLAYQASGMIDPHTARYCLGASGAVTAVMVVFACHYPTRMILVFFLIPVPIWLFVVFQVAQDSFQLLGGGDRSHVAVVVHLAGAAFGFVYYKAHLRLLNFWPDWKAWRRIRRQPKLRIYREDRAEPVSVVSGTPPAPQELPDEQLEAKLDAVLEKVARSGQASLSEPERQILLRASEIYKRRRT